jgi:hypothetical protein
MPDCKWPAGCKLGNKGNAATAAPNSKFCDKHRLQQQADEYLKREEEMVVKELEELRHKLEEMARLAQKKHDEGAQSP